MKTFNHNFRRGAFLISAVVAALVVSSCEVDDPFVKREVAPVLITFDEVTGYLAAGGLTSEPVVTKIVTAATYTNAVTLSVNIFELDKSGILDHSIGIDSIPVANLPITFSLRNGSAPITVNSNSGGKVTISTTWQALGITDVATIATTPAARSIPILLLWSGTHNGQSFARYSRVVFSKPAA